MTWMDYIYFYQFQSNFVTCTELVIYVEYNYYLMKSNIFKMSIFWISFTTFIEMT